MDAEQIARNYFDHSNHEDGDSDSTFAILCRAVLDAAEYRKRVGYVINELSNMRGLSPDAWNNIDVQALHNKWAAQLTETGNG